MKSFTNNDDAWNIHYQFLKEDYTDEFENKALACDINIVFGELNISQSGNTEMLITKQILVEISTEHDLSDVEMQNTLTHELGHAFGLDHYTTDDHELNQQWHNGIDVPSIMVSTEPINLNGITELDLKKMISLYGYDGFEKLPPNLPDWIQNIFKWYGEGSIEDQELISAIQFLVQNGIIVI